MSYYPSTHSGFPPELDRPLRSEPVRRDEVLIERGDRLMTMPIGTWRYETRACETVSRGEIIKWMEDWLIGEPALWQPLLDELAPAFAAEHAEPSVVQSGNPGTS